MKPRDPNSVEAMLEEIERDDLPDAEYFLDKIVLGPGFVMSTPAFEFLGDRLGYCYDDEETELDESGS
jgi:hypothetical protein